MPDAPTIEPTIEPTGDPSRAALERFEPPPLVLRALLGVCFAFAVVPVLFAVQYTREWAVERAGMSPADQRLIYRNTPWFQPSFLRFAELLRERLPEDCGILVTPTVVRDPRGRARWYLFLNHALYPRRIYVREPALASGTLVDYPAWLEYHTETLDTDSSESANFARVVELERIRARDLPAIRERGIGFELRYPVTSDFEPDHVELYDLRGEKPVRIPLPSEEELMRGRRRPAPSRFEGPDEGTDGG